VTGPNRLAGQTSPYLLQHAHNPVDWYPWGDEALERARREDKPILLSIGYAACHWCHVMERESFEDPETAAVMNEHFVAVKVDREERPDLDGIYMDAVQAMTGQGGWPMTVFLTPEGGPFYAGTYFPKTDRHGLPGFRKVLLAVAEAWRDRREDARGQGEAVVGHIAAQSAALEPASAPLSEELFERAFDGLRRAFDPRWGGFGPAPKFPQPMTLELGLRLHLRDFEGALEMVELTLNRMALGGVYDQLGGGFHRYSTDARWLVPHFEKMLYDNAQLVRVYTHAWQATGWPRYQRVARETATYLLRELRHPDGGFYSSQDADSDGVEGKFFVWSYDELVGHAGEAVGDLLGATPDGNWEGVNVLWMPDPAEQVAERHGLGLEEFEQRWRAGRRRLLEAREARVHPATDDKVLAAWNGLAVSALAEAGRSFGEPALVEAAVAAAEFVLGALRGPGDRLLRSWRDGRPGGPAYLDDYACMAEACLTLWETTFELRWLARARRLCDAILELFADRERGGFYQTGSDAERLVLRPRELFDNAVPSGSSVAADVLLRLAHLTGETAYEEAALGALRLVQEVAPKAPTGFGYTLSAADFALARVREVAIVGDPAAPGTRALLERVWRDYQPNRVLALAAPGDQEAVAQVPLLADRPMVDGRPTAYVCERFVCKRPVTEPDELAAQLA
jgi:uncharacterized protein YyaL (SSP411 family)